MKRLMKICLDQSLLSFIPIISWLALGLIIDNSLMNIFTLTYPIQFIYYIFQSIFSTGANISKEKDNNVDAPMSGILLGSIIAFFVFGFIVLNVDNYIRFMNMDLLIYRDFAIYSLIQIYTQLVFHFFIDKLYYEEKNDTANKYSLIFNFLNFIVLITCSLIFKNHFIIITITLISIILFTIYVIFKNTNKFKLSFKIYNFIKYDSVELLNNIAFFLIFLLGLKNVMNFGEEYILALTFVALITDTQWDVFYSVAIIAKIDISKNKFNYKEHKKNAYKLSFILLLTVFLLFAFLYHFYKLNLLITIIFILFELVNFVLYPIYKLKTCYLQLEYSSFKTAANKIVSSVLRIIISFLNTPFCTGLGQVSSTLYQTISFNIIFGRNFIIREDGYIERKIKQTKSWDI